MDVLAHGDAPPARRALPGRGERILLVDDEESVAVLTRAALESLGFHATYSTSPEEFLRLFQANPGDYDLILTDHSMHRMTGLELGVQLRREGHRHPIIVATGNRRRVDADTLKRLGRALVVDKPFEIAQLGAVVRAMLDSPPLPDETS
jgi:CheY-like chemotaxis protein